MLDVMKVLWGIPFWILHPRQLLPHHGPLFSPHYTKWIHSTARCLRLFNLSLRSSPRAQSRI